MYHELKKKNDHVTSKFICFCYQVRHGAGTGLREILKAHGKSGGKIGDITLEEVSDF